MKKISVFIMAIALVLGMIPAVNQVYAASENTMSFEARVPADGNIQGEIPKLVLDITSGTAKDGETIRLTLSDGADWNSFSINGAAVSLRSGNVMEIMLTEDFVKGDQIMIPMDVKLDSASGDLTVEVDSNGTAITDGSVRYAKVMGNKAQITISDKKANVARADDQKATMITITESTPLAWEASGTLFELRLPSGLTWSTDTKINGANVASNDIDGRDLMIDMTVTNNLDRIRLEPVVNIPRSAELGSLEVIFTQGAIEEDTVEIANIVDYGFDLSIDKPVEINLGQTSSTQVKIKLAEMIPNTFIANRTYSLTIQGAEFDKAKALSITKTAGNINLSGTVDNDEITLRPTGTSSIVGKWDIAFNIIPDKEYTGDVIVSLESSNGAVEGEITIANVMKGSDLMIGNPGIVNLGLQQQLVPDITIEETEKAGLKKGIHTLMIDPDYDGIYIDQATVETEGNIDIDNFEFKDGMFTFEVKSESSRPSKIMVKDIKVTLDRFAFSGDYSIEHLINAGKNNEVMLGKALFFRAADSSVMPGFTGIFRIGNPNFTTVVNGQTKVVEFDTAPYIENSRTMMSVKAAGLALGVDVKYNADDKTVTVGSDQTGSVAVMKIGDRNITINGVVTQMDTAAVIVNSRTFIPVKYLGEAFGADILWEGTTQTVTVTRK